MKEAFVEFMRGGSGRLARIGFGLVVIAVGLLAIAGTAGTIVAIFGLVPVAAGAFGFCPLGPLFGVDFRGRERPGHA